MYNSTNIEDVEREKEHVKQLKHGDHVAFGRLYSEREQMVTWIVRSHLDWDCPDIEDACQEVWLRAYRKAETIQGSSLGQIYAWLYKVATTVVLNFRKRNLRPEEVRLVLSGDRSDNDHGDHERAVETYNNARHPDRRLLEAVRSAAKHLSRTYQPTIEMILGGADYTTVGRALGISEASARQHVCRSLPTLRSVLGVTKPMTQPGRQVKRKSPRLRVSSVQRRAVYSRWKTPPRKEVPDFQSTQAGSSAAESIDSLPSPVVDGLTLIPFDGQWDPT